MKELMLGNKALARGLYEAGCKVISSYPGTPSTEITEEAALYDEIYLNDNKPLTDDRFILLSSEVLKFEIELNDNKQIKDLFMMTPYWHHTSLQSKEKLNTLNHLKVHLEFNIDLYQKK